MGLINCYFSRIRFANCVGQGSELFNLFLSNKVSNSKKWVSDLIWNSFEIFSHRVHPRSHCGLRPVFPFWRHGLRSHDPGIHYDTVRIRLPTSRPIHEFYVLPTDYTIWSVPSKSSDLRRQRSFAYECEMLSYTLTCIGQWNECDPL